MTATACTVNGCTTPARLTHNVYGDHCITHAGEVDEGSHFWRPIAATPPADDNPRTTKTTCHRCEQSYGLVGYVVGAGVIYLCERHSHTRQEATPPATDDTIMVTHPDTGGTKGQKLARFDLIPPDVLTRIAEHYGRGAAKYDDHNWARGYNWSLSYAALLRHLTAYWAGTDTDAETGSHHLDAVIFHAITLRAFADTHPELDDRWATTGRGAGAER